VQRYQILNLDLNDIQQEISRSDLSAGALVVARRDGIPVGSALFFHGGTPISSNRTLIDQLKLRPGEPHRRAIAESPSRVTVIICTRNRPQLLARCLRSIADSKAIARDEVEAEIVVIDNGSPNKLTAKAAMAYGARVVREPVQGLDVARNRAVRVSSGGIIAFVDDDVVVDTTWLRTLNRTFSAHPEIDAVTGGVLAFQLDTPAQIDFERYGGFFLGWNPGVLDERIRQDFPFNSALGLGCNMAFRHAVFGRIGRFDEALDTGRPMAGGGDLDILIRVAMVGTIFYEPSALVFHEHRREWSDLRYQYYSWGKSWAAVLYKWWYCSPTEHRLPVRSAVRHTLNQYIRGLIWGPRKGGYRRSHSCYMLIGFAVGTCRSYPRSIQRMAQRRKRLIYQANL
jgi:glycosyltransferase involved in cell wall biosynthesis